MDYQGSDARIEYDTLPIAKFSTGRKYLIETLREEIRPVVFGKFEFECREKLMMKSFSLDFSDYQESDEKRKVHDLSLEYSFTSVKFPIEILMEEINLIFFLNIDINH